MAGNDYTEDMPDCPLCLEPFGLDDINFFPCVCRYQVCRFCWHRIRTDENGLCPHCREPYTENPAEYTPPTQEQILKLKSEKKQKSSERKQKLMESRKNLADVRVIQKNLVFVVGLSPRLADPETLRKNEYFGKYGRIFKVVINNHTVYNGTQGPSVSAYVTFYRNEDALKAISAVNNAYIDGRYLKASFGTTKYCTTFLRGSQCTKPDCMYLHALGDDEASFTKEDMHMGKHQVYEQSALAAAHLDQKDTPNDNTAHGSMTGGGGGRKSVRAPHLVDSSEGSALPSTASWASSIPKPPEPAVNHILHSKSQSKTIKQRPTQNHSLKSLSVTANPKSNAPRHSLKPKQQKESTSKSSSPILNSVVMERTSSVGSKAQRTNSTSSINSKDSSSKPGTPSLSPKSSLSKSLSSGSLNPDCAFESPESSSRPLPDSNYTESVDDNADDADTHNCDVVNERLTKEVPETIEPVKVVSELPAVSEPAVVVKKSSVAVNESREVLRMRPVVEAKPVALLEQELAREAELRAHTAQMSVPPTGASIYAVNLPGSEYKVVEGGVSREGMVSFRAPVNNNRDVLNVLSGNNHFGSLGVSWNTQVPSTLIGSNSDPTDEVESKVVTPQHDDDLGFDPWDVSQQGLADLLETEAEEQKRPPLSKPSLSNGVREHSFPSALPNRPTASSKGHNPWQDEFKALFPDVNISFGGPGFPSTATKTKSDKATSLHQALNATHNAPGYHPTQLANALSHTYHPLHSSMPQTTGKLVDSPFTTQENSFPVRGFPASSTKVVSGDAGLPGNGRGGLCAGDWPGFRMTETTKTAKEPEIKDMSSTLITTSMPHTTCTSSLPSPPPGFMAKPASSTTTPRTAATKVATPSTVGGGPVGVAVGGGSLNSSVNHALWANSQIQGKAGHVVSNHLLQSWNNFLNFSALTPAQQQQLARSSQNYQHLLAQQYLLMQSYLMRGYPMLQAQAQAQAQIQAGIRTHLQQHLLRQQQQQQQAAGFSTTVTSGTTVASSASLPKSVATSKTASASTVFTSPGTTEGAPTTVQASSTSHSATTSSKGATQSSKPSSNQSKAAKHGPTNSSKNHHHNVSSKSKSSTSSKQTKSSSTGNSERKSRHKNTGK